MSPRQRHPSPPPCSGRKWLNTLDTAVLTCLSGSRNLSPRRARRWTCECLPHAHVGIARRLARRLRHAHRRRETRVCQKISAMRLSWAGRKPWRCSTSTDRTRDTARLRLDPSSAKRRDRKEPRVSKAARMSTSSTEYRGSRGSLVASSSARKSPVGIGCGAAAAAWISASRTYTVT